MQRRSGPAGGDAAPGPAAGEPGRWTLVEECEAGGVSVALNHRP